METTLGFEHIERLRAAFLAGTAHGELHHHDGQAQNDQESKYSSTNAPPPYSPAI